jgi:hypothetical protein
LGIYKRFSRYDIHKAGPDMPRVQPEAAVGPALDEPSIRSGCNQVLLDVRSYGSDGFNGCLVLLA